MRTKLIAGNWKMYKSYAQAQTDFAAFASEVKNVQGLEFAIAAPAVFLPALAGQRARNVSVLAQNCHWEKEGAFTGETSASMLGSIGAQGSLVGHSERRQMNGETNVTAGKRVGALLRAGLTTVFCVGETLAEREAGKLSDVLRAQLVDGFAAAGIRRAFEVLGANPSASLLSIAYEPVWAIGTGKAATAKEAQEAHAIVRGLLAEVFGANCADSLRILYGGSVNASNVTTFMSQPDVDGALVGGASLDPVGFAGLCKKCLS